ncbi:MAG: ribonuclease, partial [Blastocatellia bacterium]|nr:ribonuclease [Blastocatellia bacterium]
MTALGGISEIGRNMTVFEHLGRLLIIDCGVMFPTHDEPGVDLILPDLRHVEDRLEDIEALVLTHAHEDHIGAIPFLLRLRPDIPVVGSKFTLAMVAAKCREHRIKPVFVEVKEGQSSRHGVFECEYFAVNHSIPDALAIAVYTGAGTVLHTGDIKLDQTPLD